MQTPDAADGKYQYREIGQDVEYGCYREKDIRTYASPRRVRLPDFAPRNTLACGGYEDGEVEGEMRPYDELRDVVCDAGSVGHEYAEVHQEYGELRDRDCG